MKKMKYLKYFLLIACIAMLYALWAGMMQNKLVHTYKNVEGDVSVHIVESRKGLNFLNYEDRYALRVTHGDWNRGVFMDISLFDSNDDVQVYLEKCAVTSSDKGITFVQPNGITLFIPRNVYEPRQ